MLSSGFLETGRFDKCLIALSVARRLKRMISFARLVE